MKIAVRDFLVSSKLHELDTDSGAVTAASSADIPVRGYCAKLGDTHVAFYADQGRLVVRAGDAQAAVGPIGVGAKVELTGENLRTLRVVDGGEVLLRVTYPNPVNPPMELDLSMAEEEDFDLGLYVRNVTSDFKRARRMIDRWSA